MSAKNTIESFYAKLIQRPNGCLEWTGSKNAQGYGALKFCGEIVKAHRLAYQIAHGPIPDGLCVCHHCDNPSCCNVAHLFLGTHLDNMRDAIAKDRHRGTAALKNSRPIHRGTKNSHAILDETKVIAIRRAYRAGETQASLAQKYGVRPVTIQAITSGRNWSHVSFD